MFKGIFNSVSKIFGKIGKAIKTIGKWLAQHWKALLIVAIIVAVITVMLVANWPAITAWFSTAMPKFTAFMKSSWAGLAVVGTFLKNTAISAGGVIKNVFEKITTVIGKASDIITNNPKSSLLAAGLLSGFLKPKYLILVGIILVSFIFIRGGIHENSSQQ